MRRIRPLTPARIDIFQYGYDFGIEGACSILRISEDKFWEILNPPFPVINEHTRKPVTAVCPPELADIITTSYPWWHKKLISPSKDAISEEDSLHDAITTIIQLHSYCSEFNQEEIREEVCRIYALHENFRKLNRRKTEGGL